MIYPLKPHLVKQNLRLLQLFITFATYINKSAPVKKDFFRMSKRERMSVFACIAILIGTIIFSICKHSYDSPRQTYLPIQTQGAILSDSVVSTIKSDPRKDSSRIHNKTKRRKSTYVSPGSRDFHNERFN